MARCRLTVNGLASLCAGVTPRRPGGAVFRNTIDRPARLEAEPPISARPGPPLPEICGSGETIVQGRFLKSPARQDAPDLPRRIQHLLDGRKCYRLEINYSLEIILLI